MYGIVLIAVLAVMGGAIAYIGDKLGTKVGKRKLTIFGLRPKHTSILMTIITGILISGATLGILSVTSSDVRTALFGMEALKAELQQLTTEVTAKNVELDEGRKALEAKNQEYATLTAKVKETSAKLAEISEELTAVMTERDRTAAALSAVQQDYNMAKGDLDKARKDIETLQIAKNELDNRVTTLNEAKTALQGDVDSLTELTVNLRKGMQIVREGTVIFRAGELIATAVVPGGEQRADMENALSGILDKANDSLIERLNVEDKKLQVLWISRTDFENAVTAMVNGPESIIVRVSSAGNIVYGEPVIASIEVYPNRLLYTKGEKIYTEIIEPTGDAKRAEADIMTFLGKVNATAIKQGVLPDPLHGTVGAISGAELYNNVNKIKRANSKVEIAAVASNDIYTAGPLNIEIVVRTLLF